MSTRYVIENKFGPREVVNGEETAKTLVKGQYETTYRKVGLLEARRIRRRIDNRKRLEGQVLKSLNKAAHKLSNIKSYSNKI